MNAISFQNVRHAFGDQRILDGLTFDVPKGDIFVILGPSGSGKSVTLKHIVGLMTPDTGTVTVASRKIGYLFQGGALLAWKTIAENVALPLEECSDLAPDEIARRVREALAAVEMADAAEKYPAEVSGGMLKRAGLARAIVQESEILLYDEPTSGLDAVTAERIHRLIVRLHRERALTSVVVTHDVASALRIADRILYFRNGRAAVCAPPAEFIKSDNRDVRELLDAAKGDLP